MAKNDRVAGHMELWPIDRLKPYEQNPRTHSAAQVEQISDSISEFGFNNPILVDAGGEIIAGHGRLMAAQRLGMAEVPVVILYHLTEAQRRAYVIADNQLAIQAGWDEDLLSSELQALLDADFNIDVIGFDDTELQALLGGAGSSSGGGGGDDSPPPPPEDPVSVVGDVWILGPHRLICGDSRDGGVLDRLMDGHTAALYATDPPYGVGYDGTAHPQNQRDRERGRAAGSQNRDWSEEYRDHNAWDHFGDRAEFEAFLEAVFKNALQHVTPAAAWYCWHASATSQSFRSVWERVGVRYHQTITWVKPTHVLGFSMWNYRTEPCLMGWQQGHKPAALPVPDEYSNCWEVDWEGKARCVDNVHPTQKPLRLFDLPMRKHTNPGDICLETFAGSGSQIIAAGRIRRRCFAVERMPTFCDVIIHRWQDAFGGEAVLEESGETFKAVGAERLGKEEEDDA